MSFHICLKNSLELFMYVRKCPDKIILNNLELYLLKYFLAEILQLRAEHWFQDKQHHISEYDFFHFSLHLCLILWYVNIFALQCLRQEEETYQNGACSCSHISFYWKYYFLLFGKIFLNNSKNLYTCTNALKSQKTSLCFISQNSHTANSRWKLT